jgi:hypothetical protein
MGHESESGKDGLSRRSGEDMNGGVKHRLSVFPLLAVWLSILCPERSFSAMELADKEIAPGITVVAGEFGIYRQGDEGEPVFEKTDAVPLIVEQNYVWRLRVRTKADSVQVREEFKLPAPPKVWNPSSEHFEASKDGASAVSELDLPVDEGVIEHGWSVAKGDPIGEHTIKVFIQGKLAWTFHFKVVEAVQAELGSPARMGAVSCLRALPQSVVLAKRAPLLPWNSSKSIWFVSPSAFALQR